MTKRKLDQELPISFSVKRPTLSNDQPKDISVLMTKVIQLWQQCTKNQQVATTENDFATIIALACEAIHLLQHTILVSFYDICSHAHTQRKEYSKALASAMKMITSAPLYAKGYEYAGDAFVDQNNLQQAIPLYQTGIEKILNSIKDGDVILNNNNDTSIAHGFYSTTIASLQCKLVTIESKYFDMQILALVKQHAFIKAAKIARQWIHYFQKSTKAYMKVGDVYMIQGNSNKAFETYQEGYQQQQQQMISQSSSTNDNVDDSIASLFLQKMDDARKQRDKRIDFISALPIEVVANSILPFLPAPLFPECMLVCKNWKSLIFECPNAWRTIKLPVKVKCTRHIDDLSTVTTPDHCIEDHQCAYVRSISLEPNLSFTQIHRWLLGINRFLNLETLVFYYDIVDLDILCNGLSNLGSTLKKLDVYMSDIHHERLLFMNIWVILEHFGHITHFAFTGQVDEMGTVITKLPVLPSLIHLRVMDPSWLMELDIEYCYRNLEILCEATPNLRYLDAGCATNGLSVIHQGLCKLQYLQINKDDDYYHSERYKDITTKNYYYYDDGLTNNNGRIGGRLRHLTIYNSPPQDPTCVFTVLTENKETLEEFTLLEPTENGIFTQDDIRLLEEQSRASESWQLLSGFTSTRLRVFRCNLIHLEQPTLLSMLQRCPQLEQVYIMNNSKMTDEIFEAFLGLDHLNTLDLRNCTKITHRGLKYFFSQSMQRHQQLKTLVLEYMDHALLPSNISTAISVDDVVTENHYSSSLSSPLYAIGKLQALVYLQIPDIGENRLLERILSPREGESNFPHLQEITLTGTTDINVTMLRIFSHLPNLRRLIFENVQGTIPTKKAIQITLDEFPNLESIIIDDIPFY
ncbi:hypothetical protein BDA99DRAFT_524384 [Phascolomyces articulosus]|uniref:F-box domain-containing protein n=1 Tax=Phascolomyces articulosus TaxID=60185 RepID=A0AAD5K170_9FUNG|nr:hypothetical protein BDA99DRAFT_524384 [Phascolomyces articulosus]